MSLVNYFGLVLRTFLTFVVGSPNNGEEGDEIRDDVSASPSDAETERPDTLRTPHLELEQKESHVDSPQESQVGELQGKYLDALLCLSC